MGRLIGAVEDVRDRLHRATSALEAAGISYAVVGGHAVAAWIARVDHAAVRNTPDVNLLIQREEFEAAKTALAAAGFVFLHAKGIAMFLDGPNAKARDAVHVLFAGEKVRESDLLPTPSMNETEDDPSFRVVSLEALVRMKLTSYRRKDQVHLLDLIDLGLVDESWLGNMPTELAERLQALLDDLDG